MEYIDGNFSKVIVTGYKPTSLSYFRCSFYCDTSCIPSGSLRGGKLLSAAVLPHEYYFSLYDYRYGFGYLDACFSNSGTYDFYWNNGTAVGSLSNPSQLEFYGGWVRINSTAMRYSSSSIASGSYPSHPLSLFFSGTYYTDNIYVDAFNNPNGRAYLPVLSKGRVYRFETYELSSTGNLSSAILSHDFLPCLQQSSGSSGLYDIVDGKFHPLHTPITVKASASSKKITVRVSQTLSFPLYVCVSYAYGNYGDYYFGNTGVVLSAGTTSATVTVSNTVSFIRECLITTDSSSFSDWDYFGEPLCFTDSLLLYAP